MIRTSRPLVILVLERGDQPLEFSEILIGSAEVMYWFWNQTLS
jgi:hypothetical protein